MKLEKALENFGAFIQELRRERGDTLADVSDRSGVMAGYIWRIEKNRKQPTLQMKLKLLGAGYGFDNKVLKKFEKAHK